MKTAFAIGAAVGLALCVLFGVLDVQCMDDPAGGNWNAEAQRCER